jgi:hypothetical protein
MDGHVCHARSEGHACHACSEGHACHARRIAMGYQTVFGGLREKNATSGSLRETDSTGRSLRQGMDN